MKKTFCFVVFFSLLFYCHSQLPGKQYAQSMTSIYNPGNTTHFLVYKPADSASSTKHPLIIFLHGDGQRGTGSNPDIIANNSGSIPYLCANGASMQFTVNSVTSTFYVLSPQCPGSNGFHPHYVKDMWQWAVSNLNVDTNRVYLTGLSYGGGGVWGFMLDSLFWAKRFPAIAPMSAITGGGQQEIKDAVTASNTSVWAFHATGDNTVPVSSTNYYSANWGYTNPSWRWTYYHNGNHATGWQQGSDTAHTTYAVDSSNNFFWPYGGSTSASFLQNPNVYEWFLSKSRTVAGNPTATAGNDQTIYTTSTTLTGSGTPMSPDTIRFYAWTQQSGPNIAGITSPSLATTTVTGLTVGAYVFRLTVTGGNGLTGFDEMQVTVLSPNPVANAGTDQAITLPTNTTTLNGSGTAVNGATINRYAWIKTSGPSGGTISDSTLQNPGISNLVQGTYTFTLTVFDNNGLSGSDDVTITVNAAGLYYGMDSVQIGGRNCLVKRPTEDPQYNANKIYPLLLEIGDQEENLANNPSGLAGLFKSGTPKMIQNGATIYPNDKNGKPIYYIMAKIQPLSYSDVVFPNEITPFFTGVLAAYPIDTSKYDNGMYKYIMLAGTERGADAWFNCTNWALANGFGSNEPTWVYKIRKIVTSRVNNINNGNATTNAIWQTFNGRTLRYFEPVDGNSVPDSTKVRIAQNSNAYQQLFRFNASIALVYDSMYSSYGTDTVTNIYRLLVDDSSTTGSNFVPGVLSSTDIAAGLGQPGVMIYPNPVNNILFLTCTKGIQSVVLYTMSGQKILIKTPAINATGTMQVNTTGLPKGIYLLQVTDRTGFTQTQKLLKQ
jgi:poly(3-hydroxybutyrate) depolymerase